MDHALGGAAATLPRERFSPLTLSGLYLHAREEHGNVTLSEVLQAAQK
jgi:hypothetical protein